METHVSMQEREICQLFSKVKASFKEFSCKDLSQPWYTPRVFQLRRVYKCNEAALERLHDLARK